MRWRWTRISSSGTSFSTSSESGAAFLFMNPNAGILRRFFPVGSSSPAGAAASGSGAGRRGASGEGALPISPITRRVSGAASAARGARCGSILAAGCGAFGSTNREPRGADSGAGAGATGAADAAGAAGE
ncbi:MAG: hypothetical protein ACLUNV_06890 [Sutterella wadsworthensis]